MFEKMKLMLAGWSFKTFLKKKARPGIRAAITFALGRIGAGKLAALGITIDPGVLEGAIDAALWVQIELLANIVKVKAERSDKWAWLSYFL